MTQEALKQMLSGAAALCFLGSAVNLLIASKLRSKAKTQQPQDIFWKKEKLELPRDPLWTFQQVIRKVHEPETRQMIVRGLTRLAEAKEGELIDGEPISYHRSRLGYDIYRETTGMPYCQPKYVSFVTLKDIKNRHFMELIHDGIRTYERAPKEERERFNMAVMPRVKEEKVVASVVSQQQR